MEISDMTGTHAYFFDTVAIVQNVQRAETASRHSQNPILSSAGGDARWVFAYRQFIYGIWCVYIHSYEPKFYRRGGGFLLACVGNSLIWYSRMYMYTYFSQWTYFVDGCICWRIRFAFVSARSRSEFDTISFPQGTTPHAICLVHVLYHICI